MSHQQLAREIAKQLLKTYFKNDDRQPFEATDGQADIFNTIFLRRYARNQIMSPTQYGKSDIVSMALVFRSSLYHEKWAIVAGSADKALIIMQKVIQHTFDHPRFYALLDVDPNFPLDRLRRERSKENITWQGGGGIQIFTAKAGNSKALQEALTGFGCRNIIEEEAPLIPNEIHSMVMRMLGGHKDNFLCKIGNPFYRNHFYKSFKNPKYHLVFIDYIQALAEGRYTEDYISEMREEMFFDILYECKFPSSEDYLSGGYRRLISDDLLESAFITKEEYERDYCIEEIKDDDGNIIGKKPEGDARLGVDVGAGGDRSAYILRYTKVAFLLSVNQIPDTMQQVPITEQYLIDYNVEDYNCAIDHGGIGHGAGDRLVEKDHEILLIQFGQSSPDKNKFKNMRAFMYKQMFDWLVAGGKIVKDVGFYELNVINYKQDSQSRFQIQPKEELKDLMKKLGIKFDSPDIADGLALTFADNSNVYGEDDVDIL